ncbi:MAG TPA: arginyltransferase [Tepidisphaeraceae bacterium]|nr:arginyltransferase [Tepidisphaeraceae bacterium]
MKDANPKLADRPASMGAACPYPAWHPPMPVQLTVLPEHPCPYLPGRVARSRALWAEQISGPAYHALMDAGFRRSGKLVYQPVCAGCRQCLPIRVPVNEFQPGKSQRRCARRNSDLTVSVGPPVATVDKWQLYLRYITDWHSGETETREGFESFLYDSPVPTLEFSYRDQQGCLLAVGICDVCPEALSSVYFYFDPAQAHRGLGTFGALHEIAFAQNLKLPHYYLGYWIDRCSSMRYKAAFKPHEILHPDNVWRQEPMGSQ